MVGKDTGRAPRFGYEKTVIPSEKILVIVSWEDVTGRNMPFLHHSIDRGTLTAG
jgi:hypothetical protein